WTVDARCQQFRKAHWAKDGTPGRLEFLEFDEPKGDALLAAYIRSLTPEELDALLASGIGPEREEPVLWMLPFLLRCGVDWIDSPKGGREGCPLRRGLIG